MNGIGIFVDIFFVAAIILTVVISTKRGFVRTVMKAITLVLAVIIAVMFCSMVGEIIAENYLYDEINGFIFEKIATLAQNGEFYDLATLFEDQPAEFKDMLSRFGADIDKLAGDFRAMSEATEDTIAELAETISSAVVLSLSKILAFFIILIVSIIALSLISFILGLVTKIPVIHSLDTFLGFILGVGIAFLIVVTLSTLISELSDRLYAIFPNSVPENIREESFFLKAFADFDFIKSLVSIELN